jgi:D-lactate dehydrogenase
VNPTKTTQPSASLLSTRAIDRYRISSDASHFHLIPEAVATPQSANEIAQLFHYATANETSVTFRSGGTSLSGQAVSDAILIDTRRNFREIEVLDNGFRVRVQPGATVRAVNARLARFGRKLGPDPASEIACTIGGVIANNSSGMACGITFNTFRTLESATVILANGTIINTADSNSDEQLALLAPVIYLSLKEIKAEIDARPDLKSKIRDQYAVKNTMGYSLNSFTDFESMVDIFLHLLIGSEGTLGFISEAIFETIPLLSNAATSLLIFEDLIAATQALEPLKSTHPATIELMDYASLRAGKVDLGAIQLGAHAALLVEYQAADEESLSELVTNADLVIKQLNTVNTPVLSTDQSIRNDLWHIRKGLYASVAGARKSGTTALLEDIAVPVSQLASTCIALQALFKKYVYDDAVIFGHAKDGNIHFLVSEDFQDPEKAERYRLFTEDMVDLVLSKSGSLKAEHGTGRMMAPFVERQFGSELYSFMLRIKDAFDPAGVLNPGVLISNDDLAHMHHIKFNPTVAAVVDNCVECGYCEPICPSKDLTTTPRQRIVLQRALTRAEQDGDKTLFNELLRDSRYNVEETCAVDGLCESSCPVGINTGSLVTSLRAQSVDGLYETAFEQAAEHWGAVTKSISTLLSMAGKLPSGLLEPINRVARDLLGKEKIPKWSADLPRGGEVRAAHIDINADFVLFTSCLETIFEAQTSVSLKSLAAKAGLKFTTPQNIPDLCCGTPWKSKGLTGGYETVVLATYEALLIASENGRLPIVCDNSSCTEGIIKALMTKSDSNLQIIDSIVFADQYLLPKLKITKMLDSVVLHPTCSSTVMGIDSNFEKLAHAISRQVTIPYNWGCCAFAGDRGMLHPELTASATKAQANEVKSQSFDAYLSTNLTCEIGMSRATGHTYRHILCQLDLLSEANGEALGLPEWRIN